MKKVLKIIIPIIILICLIYYSLVIIFKNKKDEYETLGYNESQIEVIKKLKNPELILNYNYDEKIILFLSNNNFKEENLDRYLILSNKYNLEIEDIIYIVNNNYDTHNIEYNKEILNLMKENYYIDENLDRYLNYKNLNNTNDTETITAINCNLDYEFYTNTTKTDLSKGYLILVNKFNYLEQDYIPSNMVNIESKYGVNQPLESTVYEQYKKMWNDASNAGLSLYINSPYRSYSTQNYLYHNYAKRDGYTLADTYSARPGYSEHQTGLAFDVTSRTTNFDTFAYSNEYKWLQENAHKYGFILRYPKGKEYITGYQYESWHYRYVGIEAAKKIKELDITFEEYYAYYVK